MRKKPSGVGEGVIINGITYKPGACLRSGAFVINPKEMDLNVCDLLPAARKDQSPIYAAVTKLCQSTIAGGDSTAIVTVKSTRTQQKKVLYGCEFVVHGTTHFCEIGSNYLEEIPAAPSQKTKTKTSSQRGQLQLSSAHA